MSSIDFQMDTRILKIGFGLLLLYMMWEQTRNIAKLKHSNEEVRKLLDPYFDVRKRRWVSGDDIDPKSSTISDVVASPFEALEDESEDEEVEQSDGE